jgi:hypothetical protein
VANKIKKVIYGIAVPLVLFVGLFAGLCIGRRRCPSVGTDGRPTAGEMLAGNLTTLESLQEKQRKGGIRTRKKPTTDEKRGSWFVPPLGGGNPLHSGVARFDINCRCRVVSEVKTLPPEECYGRGGRG